MDEQEPGTRDPAYARRLERLSSRWWRRALDVQAPYRRYLRRLELGATLDVGCGIGRNLRNLAPHAVGIDHNVDAVALARDAGFTAFTSSEFAGTSYATPGRFDALLVAHVLEHLSTDEARDLVRSYLPYLRPDGRVVLITPQEAGYRTDRTHRTFLDFAALRALADDLGLTVQRTDSFPFPRVVGRLFPYNEFLLIARRTTDRQ